MSKLKYAAAVQENGPNYFVISTGKWRAPTVAKCDREEDAKRLVHADNNHDALVKALKAARDFIKNTENLSGHAMPVKVYSQIMKALSGAGSV